MTDDEIDAHIQEIREKRAEPIRHYEQLKAERAAAKSERLKVKIDKKLAMFERALERTDKAIEHLNKQAHDIRCLRIELEGNK